LQNKSGYRAAFSLSILSDVIALFWLCRFPTESAKPKAGLLVNKFNKMKSIERRFVGFQEKDPNVSSLIIFRRTIEGQSFTQNMMKRWFYKLVDKDDYALTDKKAILKHLTSFLKAEDNKK